MQNIANLSRSACDASAAALSQTSCIEMLPQLIKYEPCQLILTLSDSGVEIQKLSCEFVINDYHRCVGFTRAIAQMAD
jgi:hypothetical protein